MEHDLEEMCHKIKKKKKKKRANAKGMCSNDRGPSIYQEVGRWKVAMNLIIGIRDECIKKFHF